MSLSIHCFEGLKINKISCLFPCCRRKRKNDDNPVIMIQDIGVDFWVINAHKSIIDNIEKTSPNEKWDILVLGNDGLVAELSGERFQKLRNKGEYIGKKLSDVFPESIVEALDPLVEFVTKNEKATQLHTIYKMKKLTLFAYPIKNEKDKLIGVNIIYRPSKYSKSDIASIISESITPPRKSMVI